MVKARQLKAKAAARPKHYTGSEIGAGFTKMLEDFRAERVHNQGGIQGETLSSDDPYFVGKQKSRLEYAVARFAFVDENEVAEACAALEDDNARRVYTLKVDRAKELLADLNASPSYDKNYRNPWVNFENFILQVARPAHPPCCKPYMLTWCTWAAPHCTAPTARIPPPSPALTLHVCPCASGCQSPRTRP